MHSTAHPPLLTAQSVLGHVHLIVGSNPLAGARCARSLECGAVPVVVAPATATVHYSLARLIDEGAVTWVQKAWEEEDLHGLGRAEVQGVVDTVFVTVGGKSAANQRLSSACRRLRIPVNVTDAPNLCTFTLLSTHSDGPLQIGITTSGKGCRLASRIKREVAATLPPGFGEAIERLGAMRRKIWEEDHRAYDALDLVGEDNDEEKGQKADFNRLVLEDGEKEADHDHDLSRTRRMRWLAQICEYWPLRRLAAVTDADVDRILHSYTTTQPNLHASLSPLAVGNGPSDPGSTLPARLPQVLLAGSGPGHPSLLTMATHNAIKTATYILADKLVPAAVLDLIPRRTPVHIARKFPGNAEAAQTELLELGLHALKQGHTVLRLKQGDPYIYGRGGEEYSFFHAHGYTPTVLPGITSALSAPLFAHIPATQRGVADQILICTGTGRKGAQLTPPPFVSSQTVVFLMALHRLEALVDGLVGRHTQHALSNDRSADQTDAVVVETGPRAAASNPAPWPSDTPCAVVERASCPDQRVIRSTLQHVVAAVEEAGSRPPGLLVLGRACEVLRGRKGAPWLVEDGFGGFGDVLAPELAGVVQMGGESINERTG